MTFDLYELLMAKRKPPKPAPLPYGATLALELEMRSEDALVICRELETGGECCLHIFRDDVETEVRVLGTGEIAFLRVGYVSLELFIA